MVLLDNDSFLANVAKLFQKCRSTGSVVVTYKKYDGRTKPVPRKGKGPGERKGLQGQAEASEPPPSDNKCVIRASDGKKKISTVVSTKEVIKFQMAYSTLLRTHMDGLKKKAKSSKGKDSKAPRLALAKRFAELTINTERVK